MLTLVKLASCFVKAGSGRVSESLATMWIASRPNATLVDCKPLTQELPRHRTAASKLEQLASSCLTPPDQSFEHSKDWLGV